MNPSGVCRCGCGEQTSLARQNWRKGGWVKGQPLDWRPGHNGKKLSDDFDEDAETGCWVWNRAKNEDGYGLCWNGDRNMPAHRWYYERYVGPIPEGYRAHHLCCNPACVNPGHLEAVTPATNVRLGRKAKLTPEAVREIREGVLSGPKLAAKFGVRKQTIYAVRKGQTWAVA